MAILTKYQNINDKVQICLFIFLTTKMSSKLVCHVRSNGPQLESHLASSCPFDLKKYRCMHVKDFAALN